MHPPCNGTFGRMRGQDGGAAPALSNQEPNTSAASNIGELDPKFRAPATRAGVVARTTLLDRLFASDEPLITVVAPPGYGKTTLLAQWAERLGPRAAWVSCEKTDNDPVAFWTAVITALDQIAPVSPAASQLLATSGGGVDVIPSLVSTFGTIRGPLVLVLDHAEAVTSRECQTSIAEFALRVPEGWRLAMASRDPIPIPTAQLRMQGRIVEIGTTELAMARNEASELVRAAGVELADSRMDELLQRTEGWPAGLYLAALAMRDSSPAEGFTFTGDDRLMGDYLRSELLTRVSSSQASFFMRTSVLDRMSGPLCDAVLGGNGSARVLEQLVSRNLLVVPLDRGGEWYRYHHLLRELLQTELRRNDPDLVPELHSRAAVWYESNGMPEIAVDHAQAAGDVEQVARLVLDLMNPVWASGRVDTVQRWMEWLEERPSVRHYSAIAAHGALISALLGRPSEAERWTAVAERLPATGTLPDGSTVAGTLAYLRANLCRDGAEMMRSDAREAWDGLSPTSPYRTAMLHTEGLSYVLDGDPDRADAVFAHTYDIATGFGALPMIALILAERFLIAAERDDWPAADALMVRAAEILESGRFDGYWTSALVFAAAARAAAHRGHMHAARQYVKRAARLRPLLTYALPVVSVQALLELARAYLAVVDPAGARAALEQAHGILQQRPDLGTLLAAADQLQSRLGQIVVAELGASSLTTAELRLLPLLPTHLSFPEIGDRLFISRHTVKSQVNSIYRKLGVSSRGEAVDRMTELGLHA
jgi:LuxR family transcriptional regulator, maltose regulon positive regulatory protein